LLLDKDDLVQKGYGWMLKSASHSQQTEVYEYILPKKIACPAQLYIMRLKKCLKKWKQLPWKA